MASGKITKRAVDAVQSGTVDAYLWDDEVKGFGLKVTPGGKRTYLFQFRMGGRAGSTRRWTIGEHGAFTPDQAREEAKRLRRLVDTGIDPIEASRSDAAERDRAARLAAEAERRAHDLLLRNVADRFATAMKAEKPDSYAFVESTLRLHVIPALGEVPLPNISQADVARMLDRIPAKSTALRRNAWAILNWACSWAVERGEIAASPVAGLKAPPPAKARRRVLTDRELALVWNACRAIGYPFGPMTRLLILTAARREEVAALDWRELNREARTMTLIGDRTKNEVALTLHLSEPALGLLDEIAGQVDAEKPKWPRKGFVFSTKAGSSVSGFSSGKRRLDAAILAAMRAEATKAGEDPDEVEEIEAWRIHDIRRTVATNLQRLGVRFEVTEAILNHKSASRSGIAAVYQRHDWHDEKRTALDAWATRILSIIDPDSADTNIVHFNAKRGAAA